MQKLQLVFHWFKVTKLLSDTLALYQLGLNMGSRGGRIDLNMNSIDIYPGIGIGSILV